MEFVFIPVMYRWFYVRGHLILKTTTLLLLYITTFQRRHYVMVPFPRVFVITGSV